MTRTILAAFPFFAFLTLTTSAHAQKTTSPFDQFKQATWLKDADIAIAKSTEIYTFSVENTEGSPKVAITKTVDEWVHPAKLNLSFANRIHINDEVSVSDIKLRVKGSNKLSKSDVLLHDVQEDDIFYSDSKAADYRLAFTDLTEINHAYTTKIRDARYLSLVFLSERYPIAEKDIVFDIPDWLDVAFKEYNFEGFNITKTSTANPKNGGKRLVFTVREMAGYKHETKAPNAKRVFPHLLLLFKSFKNKGQKEQIFENVGDLYAWYRGICKNIGNTPSTLATQVNQLVANKKTDMEKISAIFYWVQDNIRYIAFENGIMGFKPDACQNVYKNLYGDCKGMANLLKQMLILAGFDARLTWIGTNDIPYDYATPCLAVDNHMICTVLLNGKKYFLDGTEDYIALGDYATRIQGRQVLIEDDKGYLLDNVPSFGIDRNQIQQNIEFTLTNNLLRGTLKAEYIGETKTQILQTYDHIPKDKRIDALKGFIGSGNSNMSVKTVEISSTEEREKSFTVKAAFELNHIVSVSGKEMYLTLDVDKDFGDFVLDSTRRYDLAFPYPFDDKTITTFTLPEGYKVDYLPTAVAVNAAFLKGELKYEQKGNTIIYTKRFALPETTIKKKDFAAWNKLMKTIKAFYKDQIVLVKL